MPVNKQMEARSKKTSARVESQTCKGKNSGAIYHVERKPKGGYTVLMEVQAKEAAGDVLGYSVEQTRDGNPRQMWDKIWKGQ